MERKFFLATQNRGYHLDNKKHTIWFKKKDIKKLSSNRYEAIFFLYNSDTKSIYGEFSINADLVERSADGLYAVNLIRDNAHRRGAFYKSDVETDEFSLYELEETEALKIRRKIKQIQKTLSPVMLSLSYKRKKLSYRYLELLNKVVILESSLNVEPSLLSEITNEYERIMQNTSGEIRYEKQIINLGNTLFNLMFTEENIQKAICDENNIIYLDVDNTASFLPIEIINTGGKFIAEEVLFSFGTQRNRLPKPLPKKKELNIALLYIPEKTLTRAEQEISFLFSVLSEYANVNLEVVQHPMSYHEFHKTFEENDIVHLITHGVKQKRGNAWLIDKDNAISGEQLSSFTSPPALVFAHTCETAYAPAEDSRYIVSALLQSGVKNVIAATGSLTDDFDANFLEEFYRTLLSGYSASASYKNALICGRKNAFLRYRFFGSHTLRFRFK